jgi:[acyl-carrier-protein] S-malonyltransferase
MAFVFPGQGAQSVGMGQALFSVSPAARRIFEQADAALGARLSERCFTGPEDELRQTIHAQPAIVTTSVAAWAALVEHLGPRLPEPVAVAGHSVGTYSALVVAGALDFPDALRLVQERARCMHEAGQRTPGAMAAVLGGAVEVVEAACREASQAGDGVVTIANYNAADQVVISGTPEAVERAGALAKERGARRVVRLAVSGAFHSPLMDWAVACYAPAVAQAPLRDPRVPVISNISGEPLADGAALRAELAAQVRAPVQWVKTMDALVALGVTHVLEIGPGQVLAGLLRRHGAMPVLSVDGPAGVERAAAFLA